jgi:hypothetical protein
VEEMEAADGPAFQGTSALLACAADALEHQLPALLDACRSWVDVLTVATGVNAEDSACSLPALLDHRIVSLLRFSWLREGRPTAFER